MVQAMNPGLSMPDATQTQEPAPKPEKNEGFRDYFSRIHFRTGYILIGVLLSGAFLWLAFRDVSLPQLSTILNQVDWRFILLALTMSVAGTLARSLRWRLLYHPHQEHTSFLYMSGLLFFSQMLNLLIPARIGELARMYFMQPIKPARTLGAIAVEKLLDLLTLLAFLLVLPLVITLPDWFEGSRQSFLMLTISLFIVSLLIFALRKKLALWLGKLLVILPQNWQTPVKNALNQALAGLDVFNAPATGLKLQAWSFLIWGLGALLNYALFFAFSLTLPFSAALFLLLTLQVGITLPSIPGKLGVFQYITILALSAFAVGKDLALSYSLVLYLVAFGPHILFGAIFGIRELMLFLKRKAIQKQNLSEEETIELN